MGTVSYGRDVVLWARAQTPLLPSVRFFELDVEPLADISVSWRWTPQEVLDPRLWLR